MLVFVTDANAAAASAAIAATTVTTANIDALTTPTATT
jgi:hypothetical protein